MAAECVLQFSEDDNSCPGFVNKGKSIPGKVNVTKFESTTSLISSSRSSTQKDIMSGPNAERGAIARTFIMKYCSAPFLIVTYDINHDFMTHVQDEFTYIHHKMRTDNADALSTHMLRVGTVPVFSSIVATVSSPTRNGHCKLLCSVINA